MNGVNRRDMRLSDYGISRAKYNELKYFCMQYGEKKQELNGLCGLHAVVADGMPRGNTTGDPTASQAMRRAMLQKDIELIEQTAVEADADIYSWLLRNVTDGVGYDYLDVPMSRNRFYDARKYFFYLLAQKR